MQHKHEIGSLAQLTGKEWHNSTHFNKIVLIKGVDMEFNAPYPCPYFIFKGVRWYIYFKKTMPQYFNEDYTATPLQKQEKY